MTSRHLPAVVLILLFLAVSAISFADNAVIGPGDKVKVTVLGAEDMSTEGTVDKGGLIALPMVGSCKVGDKTPIQAAGEIKKLIRKYVKDPQVIVEVTQKAAWVVVISGKVQKAGAYVVSPHTTLLELIGLAGGANENADLNQVNIVSAGTKDPKIINLQSFIDGKNLDANPVVQNGDMVVIPDKIVSLGTIYVLGEVKRIGAIDLRSGMRIHDAIATAGGITDMADPANASLKHKEGEPKIFDLKKAIAQDPVEDQLLQAGDTVYIQSVTNEFNIYGAVNRPGTYPMKKSMPLTDALSMAGGYTGNAHIQDVKILRTSQHTSIPVDLAKVEKLQAENIAVLPGDTVVIPEARRKTNLLQIIGAIGSLGWLFW